MELAQLLAFCLAILGALLSPGPAFLALVQSAVMGGRRRGIACALGLGLGATLWSLAAILGLNALFAIAPWAYLTLKVLGIGYLLWLAIGLWRHAHIPLNHADVHRSGTGFRRGLLVNLANPKAVLFIAAIFTAVFPVMPTGYDAVLVLITHFSLEAVFYAACAIAFGTASIRAAYARSKAWLDRAAATVLGLLAIRIAT